jgi:tetratricopeptide (TPR) repeat protein
MGGCQKEEYYPEEHFEDLKAAKAESYNEKGITYIARSLYDQAIEAFNQAIEINPRYANAYCIRGFAYENKGEYERALLDYTKTIEINPRHANAYSNRGIVYYYKKEYDKAWEDVHKAQSLGYQVDPVFLKALREKSGGLLQ